jgi:hypothetical protein
MPYNYNEDKLIKLHRKLTHFNNGNIITAICDLVSQYRYNLYEKEVTEIRELLVNFWSDNTSDKDIAPLPPFLIGLLITIMGKY